MESQGQIIPKTALQSLIAIQLVAAVLSVVIVIGLLIPLVIQLKRGSYQRAVGVQRRRSSIRRETVYSTYNLYLVYLALVDLAFLLPNIAAQLSAAKYFPRFYSSWYVDPNPNSGGILPPIEVIINGPYSAANMWINAVIAYQVLILLKTSKNVQRITQPSLTRVNLQGGVIIVVSILYSIGSSFYYYNNGWEDSWLFISMTTSIPFFYVIGVTILVQCKGYMPLVNHGSTSMDRAVRGLAFYFFRITAIFVLIWLPSGLFLMLMYELPVVRKNGYFDYLSHILIAAQPIITFCVILTKPDVYKYIRDVVSLKCIFENCTCCTKEKTAASIRVNEILEVQDAASSTNSIALLGYTFGDIEIDEADIENDDSVDVDAENETTK